VRFVNETFRKIRPGVPLLHLHGKMSQAKRQKIYWRYHEMKSAVLFATDIAARGLDFKGIDWVVQADCPEDVDTYIHRSGRTARYNEGGSALLILMPSEIRMIELLRNRKIPIEEIQVNPSRRISIKGSLQELLFQDAELKILAQKAVRSYLRSVHLMANKEVFNVEVLPHQEYAASLGLMGVPQIKFLDTKKVDKHEVTLQKQLEQLYEGGDDDNIIPVKQKRKNKSKVQKLLNKKNANVLSESVLKMIEQNDHDTDDVLVKKTENQTHLMDFDDFQSKKKDRGPTIDTLDLELDNKTDFYETAQKELKDIDPEDRKAYQLRIQKKRLRYKLKQKEEEKARKQAADVTIGYPVGCDEDFEGKENYDSSSETSEKLPQTNDSNSTQLPQNEDPPAPLKKRKSPKMATNSFRRTKRQKR